MIRFGICADVPARAGGRRFYGDARGLSRVAAPYRGVAVFQAVPPTVDAESRF
jgi:hypothetical protein